MTIDLAVVRHVASLANLALDEGDAAYYQLNLSRILDYVAQLGDLPEMPAGSSSDLAFVPKAYERPDELKPSLDPDLALVNAAVTAGSAFQVPRIID